MTSSNNKATLDKTDRTIVLELQRNARITATEIGRRAKLSTPAASERLRRLELAGVITGYHASVDLGMLGFTIQGFVRLKHAGSNYKPLRAVLAKTPAILECHHVTGDDCFIMRVAVKSMAELESLSTSLAAFGAVTTSLVYSTFVAPRAADPAL
jgi:Lrp/AsnC family leucine-responsive transcriptional regulator